MPTIRELREAARMTQFELAIALGVSVSAVYKWERGINEPKVSTLRQMSRLFDVRMDEINLEPPTPETDAVNQVAS